MYLGLDLGTTNVKVLAVDGDGRTMGEGSAPVPRVTTPEGGVEQDIDEIWDATLTAMRQATGRLDAAAIRAIGVSSQGGALGLLDDRGRPLGRVISWLDGRGQPFDRQLEEELGTDYLAEHLGSNLSAMALGQLARLGSQRPDWLSAAAQIGFVGDLIVARLCGRRAHDATSLSIGMLYNPRLGEADPDVLRRLGIQEKRLPDLLPADRPAGGLLPEVARQTGLGAGIPVSPAVHDQYAASLGAGAVSPGDVSLGTGTAWVLIVHTDRLTAPVMPRTFVCPHPVPGLFGQLLSMSNGGSGVDWALKLTGRGGLAGEELDAALEAVPPGCDGLRCWPLLVAGAGVGVAGTGLAGGGRLGDVRLGHGPNHLLRAVVEGLACELARHLELIARAGLPARRLVMCGPAATSRVTPQIVADVTERPVACIGESAISAYGATIVARRLAEPQVDLRTLAERLAPRHREVQPGPHAEVYGELLRGYLEPFTSTAEGPRSR